MTRSSDNAKAIFWAIRSTGAAKISADVGYIYRILIKQRNERLSVGNKKWEKIQLKMRQYYPEMGYHAGCYE